MFTIYQLENIIYNIDKTLEKYNSKVLIISDILRLFSDAKEIEGERVLKQIIYRLVRLNDIILLVTVSRIPSERMLRLLTPLLNKQIITCSTRNYMMLNILKE
jgi:6-phosphogluconate dehydrogenase